jgi:hypothetical protein
MGKNIMETGKIWANHDKFTDVLRETLDNWRFIASKNH